jgi:hypothetical protein
MPQLLLGRVAAQQDAKPADHGFGANNLSPSASGRVERMVEFGSGRIDQLLTILNQTDIRAALNEVWRAVRDAG